MSKRARSVPAIAAICGLAVVALVVLGTWVGNSVGSMTAAAPSLAPPAAPADALADPPERAIHLPGTVYSPAGVYRWEGGIGDRAGMHRFTDHLAGSRETTELTFVVGPTCLAAGLDQAARPVRIAGLDGVVIEPFEPPVTFGAPEGDEITRAHALGVGDRTLCVFLTWNTSTTAEELAAADRVLDSIRARPAFASWIRVEFTLDEGWDTG